MVTPFFRCSVSVALVAWPVLMQAQAVAQTTSAVPSTEQDKPALAADPADKPAPMNILGFDFTGHIDAGYTRLSGNGKFTSGVNDRVFDFDRNAALHAIDLTFAKQPTEGLGGLINFTVGKDADTIAAFGTIDKDRGPAAGVKKRFDVTQAFVQYATGAFTIIGGKYVTLAGAEVIKSPSNMNYSRSILFGYAIPFTHTGVRATYKISDSLSVIGGINRGWDAVDDPNHDLTLEWGVSFAPNPAATFALQGYSGKEKTFNYPSVSPTGGVRHLIDAVASYNVTDKLTFVLNVDYGTQASALPLGTGGSGRAAWHGVAGYANYQINDQWRLSLRGEYFNDRDGFRTGVEQKWKETTFTVAYLPTKNVELRTEVRADRSNLASFVDRDGVTSSNSQRSFGVEAIYKF